MRQYPVIGIGVFTCKLASLLVHEPSPYQASIRRIIFELSSHMLIRRQASALVVVVVLQGVSDGRGNEGINQL